MSKKANLYWNEFAWILLGDLVLLLIIIVSEFVVFKPLIVVRAIFGLIYTLFTPGYALHIALFPRKRDLDGPERVALSFGLSIAIVSPMALLLNWLPSGIQFWPIVIAESLLLGLFSLLAIIRRGRLSPDARFIPAIRIDWRSFWVAQDRTARVLITTVGLSVVLVVILLISFFLIPSPADSFTEFYLLGPYNLAESYPRQAILGESLNVTMGITNRERAVHAYYVEVWVQDGWDETRRQQVGLFGMYELGVGDSITAPLSWQMPWTGEDQVVEFLLFSSGEPEAYRELRLWLDVTEGP